MKWDGRFDLIRVRLHQAEETLKEAQLLLEKAESQRGTINRAYYTMFYAVQALSLFKQIPVSKHSANISFFDKEFVKTGIFDKKLSKSFHKAFELRIKSDYKEYEMPSKETAKVLVIDAASFLEIVNNYLQTQEKQAM